MAAHYGDPPHDFMVANNVELPWPSARGGMEWEWRVVSLKDMFPGELPALCVREKDVEPEEVLGGQRDAEATTRSRADRSRRDDGGGGGGRKETANLPWGLALREVESPHTGARGSRMSL